MEAARIMVQEAKTYGYYEKYRPELEFTFAALFYVNTLFTYMQGVRPVRASFVRKLGEEMLEYFPAFRQNPYYLERIGAEEKKLVDMQLSSTWKLLIYYKLLWGYRNFRKRIGKK